MQLSLERSKKLAGQKHRGKDFGVVFLDVFLLPKFRSVTSFSPKNHAEPVLNRMTLLVLNCSRHYDSHDLGFFLMSNTDFKLQRHTIAIDHTYGKNA